MPFKGNIADVYEVQDKIFAVLSSRFIQNNKSSSN